MIFLASQSLMQPRHHLFSTPACACTHAVYATQMHPPPPSKAAPTALYSRRWMNKYRNGNCVSTPSSYMDYIIYLYGLACLGYSARAVVRLRAAPYLLSVYAVPSRIKALWFSHLCLVLHLSLCMRNWRQSGDLFVLDHLSISRSDLHQVYIHDRFLFLGKQH
jgi:hypothetical protein